MSIRNVYKNEAKKKIKQLAESINFTMMATNLVKRPFHVVPMSTKIVDVDGVLWFLSGKNSDHNKHISENAQVQLIYSDPSALEFMTIYGNATISTEISILKKLYEKTDDAWFTGVEDPNLTTIKVVPQEAYYWDTKANNLVSLFEMGMAVITGEDPDRGEQGKINV